MNKLEYSKEDLIEMQNDIDKLQKENKQLKERIDNQEFLLKSQGKELKELYSIIDKAIEYIKSFGISDNDLKGLGECPITMNDLCNLLEILKGESNE